MFLINTNTALGMNFCVYECTVQIYLAHERKQKGFNIKKTGKWRNTCPTMLRLENIYAVFVHMFLSFWYAERGRERSTVLDSVLRTTTACYQEKQSIGFRRWENFGLEEWTNIDSTNG